MRFLRSLFLAYLTLLLAWFLPSHVRGQVTMTPHGPSEVSCCAVPTEANGAQPAKPSEKDKANCAVCFWAAGILPEVAAVIEVRPIDLALIEAREAIDQCSSWFVPTRALPRGPPAFIG